MCVYFQIEFCFFRLERIISSQFCMWCRENSLFLCWRETSTKLMCHHHHRFLCVFFLLLNSLENQLYLFSKHSFVCFPVSLALCNVYGDSILEIRSLCGINALIYFHIFFASSAVWFFFFREKHSSTKKCILCSSSCLFVCVC